MKNTTPSHPDYIFCALADTGGAHRAVARTLEKFLRARPGAPACDYQAVDIYSATSRFCDASIKLYPDILDTRPHFYNWYYDLVNRPWAWEFFYRGFIRPLMRRRVAGLFRDTTPLLVLSTCALTGRITADALEFKGWKEKVRLVVVVVDLFRLHCSWAEPRADHFLVVTEEAQAELSRLRIPAEKITRIRFPLAPDFSPPPERKKARLELGLDDGRIVALVMGGAGGNGRMEEIVEWLRAENPELGILAVAGWNQELENRLKNRHGEDNPLVRIFGYTDQVSRLMSASDFLITKPGPCTMLEAFSCRLPLVIHGFVPRQEEGNVKFILDHRLGLVLNPRDMDPLRRIVSSSDYRAEFAGKASRVGEKFFSGESAGKVLARLAWEKP